eukprot:scaffold86838_cov75-Phaeocystis_antarctica.AAC.1
MEQKRVSASEKTKPMMSCTVEPGRMSTQKPTRNSCGAQAGGKSDVSCSSLASNGCVGRHRRHQRAFLEISTSSHQYIDGS